MSHKCPDCGFGCRNFNEQHSHECFVNKPIQEQIEDAADNLRNELLKDMEPLEDLLKDPASLQTVLCANHQKLGFKSGANFAIPLAKAEAYRGVVNWLKSDQARKMFFDHGKATSPAYWADAIEAKFLKGEK